jgi:hypothetical protein
VTYPSVVEMCHQFCPELEAAAVSELLLGLPTYPPTTPSHSSRLRIKNHKYVEPEQAYSLFVNGRRNICTQVSNLTTLLLARCSDSLGAGRSRDQIPMGVRFFVPVLTGPEAHPTSYVVCTSNFLGFRCWGLALTTHPHGAPRLKKEYSYTATPCLV